MEEEEKELTVKDIRDAFGTDYEVINKMLQDLPDNYVFSNCDLLCRENYIAIKAWCEEDVRIVLQDRGYDGTDDEVADVMNRSARCLRVLDDCTDQDWEIINQACWDAGFK